MSARGADLRMRIRRTIKLPSFGRYLSSWERAVSIRPDVRSADETLDKISSGFVSMSRFGDGEFLLMRNRGEPAFQKHDPRLAKRLAQVLISERDDLIVCIPDVFGNNERLNPRSRQYWTDHLNEYRHEYYSALNMRKTYYDSLVSRVYLTAFNQQSAARLFDRWKQVWDHQDIVLIEGVESRLGVGNDLFSNARTIRRILGPAEHAFSRYDELLDSASRTGKHGLYLLALGPTATVLAHDLALLGHRALDLGHLDIEYEWFLRRCSRIAVPGKYVNEAPGGRAVVEMDDAQYRRQIIARVGV